MALILKQTREFTLHLLLAILLLLAVLPAAADENRWSESTRSFFGEPTRLRLLRLVPPSMDRAQQPHLVAIVWAYPDETGLKRMPSPLEAVRIMRADELLQTHIEQAGHGLLTVTMTGAGQHEWLFYTANPQAMLQAFNEMASRLDRWPVQLLTEADPGWETYLSLLRRELARR